MTSTLACPNETELLALAMGEPDAAAVAVHVDACTACQAKLDRFQAKVAMLRQNHGDATTPPSAEDDPTVDHDAEPSADGMTKDWTSADPAGRREKNRSGWKRSRRREDMPKSTARYQMSSAGTRLSTGSTEVARRTSTGSFTSSWATTWR